MSPHETIFLEETNRTESIRNNYTYIYIYIYIDVENNQYIQFNVRDYPHYHNMEQMSQPEKNMFQQCGAIIFVIDAQLQPYDPPCAIFKKMMIEALKLNPKIRFEIFIHKVDGDLYITDEAKMETQRDIQTVLRRELHDSNMENSITYHLTSIYDQSLYEAIGKVLQNLIPQVEYISSLLDQLISVIG